MGADTAVNMASIREHMEAGEAGLPQPPQVAHHTDREVLVSGSVHLWVMLSEKTYLVSALFQDCDQAPTSDFCPHCSCQRAQGMPPAA